MQKQDTESPHKDWELPECKVVYTEDEVMPAVHTESPLTKFPQDDVSPRIAMHQDACTHPQPAESPLGGEANAGKQTSKHTNTSPPPTDARVVARVSAKTSFLFRVRARTVCVVLQHSVYGGVVV